MCGRFALYSPASRIAARFRVVDAVEDVRPRYNVAPTDTVVIVVDDREGVRRLGGVRWGLIPWFQRNNPPRAPRINARVETIDTMPAFRESFRRKRCIVPANAFFEWLQSNGRTFLEVERFDRQGPVHRVGQIGADAVDAEFVGTLGSFVDTVAALSTQGHIGNEDQRRARLLHAFGSLIANVDMHLANFSFRLRGGQLDGLAPAYDMLPALYQPVAAEIVERRFEPPIPVPGVAAVALHAWVAAVEFWEATASDLRISADFRAIASTNANAVRVLRGVIDRLPQS